MIVIADTSPIIYLAWIGQLELLPKLFGKVILPETVYHELVSQGSGKPGSAEVQKADWLEIRQCKDKTALLKFRLLLDAGEAEAIELARELNPDLLIMDEAKGRKIAAQFGISVTGLLGVLLQAKHAGLIPNVKDQIHQLLTKTSFRVGESVVQTVLTLANE